MGRLGVARAPGTPTVESLTAPLDRALHADVAARARSVAANVRGDGTEIASRTTIDSSGFPWA
jgi:vancomycin aglycone glucosyltransferase